MPCWFFSGPKFFILSNIPRLIRYIKYAYGYIIIMDLKNILFIFFINLLFFFSLIGFSSSFSSGSPTFASWISTSFIASFASRLSTYSITTFSSSSISDTLFSISFTFSKTLSLYNHFVDVNKMLIKNIIIPFIIIWQ